MILCLWLRLLLNVWVYIINLASLVGSFTDSFIGNIGTKVMSNWFETKDQVGVNSVVSLASILGPVAGSFYALIFISTGVGESAKTDFVMCMLYLALTYTFLYLMSFIFFKEKPEKMPR